jgi:predicted nucleic acid-binding protein
VLLDTSAAVPLLVADHEHHRATLRALDGRRLGLAGHAAFETYSVLTRLPAPNRRSPATVARLLDANFPASRFLAPGEAAVLLARLPAAVAREHGVPLATRDRRALDTYRDVGAEVEVLPDV